MSSEDANFLARAIQLAGRGRYSTHPNPCVGCVLVKQGKVVGEGYHVRAGGEHAEACALAAAGEDARRATAYVTLEPCSFHGRTPSCAQALIEAGVSRVVVALEDPDERNAGKGIQMLREAGMEVVTGVLENSASRLVPGHIKRHVTGMPFVRLKLAMSLDGKVALRNGESKWITSEAARRDVQKLRAGSGAIVTGVQTVIDDDPSLSVRASELDVLHIDEAVSVARPVYILDSGLRTPPEAKLLARPGTVQVCNKGVGGGRPGVMEVPSKGGRVDLAAFLRVLAANEHSEVLFECGATLAGSLVEQGLADELIIYVAPAFMGGGARSLLNLPEIDRMSDLVKLTISDIRRVGEDFRVTATLSQGSGRGKK